MNEISVVKIGGNVIDHPEGLKKFLSDFSRIAGSKILIHAGGKEVERVCAALGARVDVLDREALDVVTMVSAGLVNKRIVAMLQGVGCDAVGLCGADAEVLTASRVSGGFVGKASPEDVNITVLERLITYHVPILCPIAYDGYSGLLHCDPDDAALSVAIATSRIAPTRLIYCGEQPGLLSNGGVIHNVTRENYDELREAEKPDRELIATLQKAFYALSVGVSSVIYKSSSDILGNSGTLVCEE